MECVLDCSAAASLFLPDEKSIGIETLFEDETNKFVVPALLWYEITNVLTIAVRRNRLKPNEVAEIFNLVDLLDIETDHSYGVSYSHAIHDLAQTYNLTGYDAAYIELAIRENYKLLSLDKNLIAAAKKAGIKVIDVT